MAKYRVVSGGILFHGKEYKIGDIFETNDLTYCDKPHYVVKINDEGKIDIGVLEEKIEKPKKKQTKKKKIKGEL